MKGLKVGGAEEDMVRERGDEREEKERQAAGTKALPTMEVLRSLSRILPENAG